MAEILASVRINAAPDLVYAEWMSLRHFPAMAGGSLEQVRWLDDEHRRLAATADGRELTAEVTEDLPGQRVEWRSLDRLDVSGVATFTPVGESDTELALQVDYDPHGVGERLGEWTGFDDALVESGLQRFRERIETPSRHEDRKGDSFVGRKAGEA